MARALADAGITDAGVSTPPRSADEAVDRLQALLDAKRYSEALRRSADWVALFPDDAALHIYRGLLLSLVNDHEGARRELERAIELDAKRPFAWELLGDARMSLDDPDGARAAYEKSLALESPNAEVEASLRELDEWDRLARVAPSEPPRRSPAHVVWSLAEDLAARRGEAVWAAFDEKTAETLLDRLGVHGDARRRERPRIVDGLMTGLSRRFTVLGWEIAGEQVDGDRARVTVRLLMRDTYREEMVALTMRAIDSPRAGQVISADVLELYRGLDRADRRAALQRQVGRSRRKIALLHLDLVRRERHWAITDLAYEQPGEARITLAAFADTVKDSLQISRAAAAIGGRPREPRSRAYRAGRVVGQLLVLGGLLAVALHYVRKRRGR